MAEEMQITATLHRTKPFFPINWVGNPLIVFEGHPKYMCPLSMVLKLSLARGSAMTDGQKCSPI